VTSVVSRIDTMCVQEMVEAMIAGQRDPRKLADLARGRMKAKRAALIEALTRRFDDHHAELARILLGQIGGRLVKRRGKLKALLATAPHSAGHHLAPARHMRVIAWLETV
jgi:transposase